MHKMTNIFIIGVPSLLRGSLPVTSQLETIEVSHAASPLLDSAVYTTSLKLFRK